VIREMKTDPKKIVKIGFEFFVSLQIIKILSTSNIDTDCIMNILELLF
jgi:hypothetical protein